ncbi:MAG: DUF4142 domain-containing protein [Minicystis sp.]
MKKATMLAGVICVIGCAGLSVAAAQTNPAPQQTTPADKAPLSKQDSDFFEDATQGGMLEVKLGELALKKATNEDVKKYAQRMIDDHTKLGNQLKQIAQTKKGVTVPNALERKQMDEVEKLAKYNGADFDKHYMSKMVDAHKDDVKAFEKQAKDGKDTDLKAAATGALPTLQDHLTQAKDIESRLKK